MARWFPSLRRKTEEPDTTKSAGVPAAATFTPSQVAALLGSVSVNGQVTGAINPLPRTDPMVAFGPGVPLIPAPLDPVRQDSGRPEPRLTEYPVSTNIPGITDRLVPWKVLRDAAGVGGLARRCIEIRKSEVATLDWTISIAEGAAEKAQADNPGSSRAEVEAELGKRLGPEIARCTAFWEEPNPREGENFTEWISKLLEEHLVLDALAIYPRLTYGGDLYALEITDGSTWKVLRDNTGGRPQPPQPAYQQILWGFPRGEFLADTDDEGNILNGYRSDRLIYKRRNVRTFTQYGYSAVEQALEDIDVWLRRRKWIRDEYTEGTVPTGMISNDGMAGWTAEQILQYERDLNDTYSGQTAERHRLRILPPGFTLNTNADVAEKYRPDYDLYLIKLLASHFDTTLAELGFTEPGGLGSAGWHEGQADVQHRKGTLPTLRWLQQLITTISRKHLGMPAELEFKFLGLEDEDEAAADAVADQRVGSGRMTYNEDRDRLGLPRYPFPEADMPIVRTQRGVIFLEGASKAAPPGETVTPLEAPPNRDADADGVPDRLEAGDGGEDSDQSAADAVKAELAAFRRWARRNPSPRRPFAFQVVTKADAPDLASDTRVVFAGGDQAPKAGSHPERWPGWDRDLTTAHAWVPRIQQAMMGALDADALAERWLAEQLVKADTAVQWVGAGEDAGADKWAVTAALAFLHRHQITVIPALTVLRLIWLEGYAIGHHSASAVLDRHDRVDGWGWDEGDADAAGDTLSPEQYDEFNNWSQRSASWATSIAANRLKVIAKALAEGGVAGATVAALAAAIRGALSDAAWALSVAVTEITRASTQAASDAYRAAGVQQVYWGAEQDEKTCEICLTNAGAGPLPLGTAWPSGVDGPPQHTSCRCWLYPA